MRKPWTYAALLLALMGQNMGPSVRAERPSVDPGQNLRSPTYATGGMVCTSHPLAANIGLDVLEKGGNAIDAAIATSAAMGLMEPTSCGIGGDLFAIVWEAKTERLYGLNASGPAPGRATIQRFREKGLDKIPLRGPLSWSVPGCVEGWHQLQTRFGTRTLAELLAPTIRYASEGVPVPPVIAGYFKNSEALLQADPGLSEAFLIEGRVPRTGEVFKNPHLGRSLELIAERGRDAFYRGPISKAIVELSDEVGGLFSPSDFADFQAEWVDPVSTNYRGYDVWEIPPPGQGIATLQILNLLEAYPLSRYGPTSADYWHLFAEAKKLAFADRAHFYADPRFAQVPVDQLISKSYAEGRRDSIDPLQAQADVAHGDELLGKADTIYLCVVDKDRNCVSLIQSNYAGFGSGLAAPGTGFGLQNRGCLFSLDPNHANCLEAGKRPFHTIIPSFVTKGGRPWLVFGVMGGDMQPQGQVQVLINLIDFQMDVQAAGDAPGSSMLVLPRRGEAAAKGGGTLLVEPGISAEIREQLRQRGHAIQPVVRNGGGYQGILIGEDRGVLQGGTESRKDGVAVGY